MSIATFIKQDLIASIGSGQISPDGLTLDALSKGRGFGQPIHAHTRAFVFPLADINPLGILPVLALLRARVGAGQHPGVLPGIYQLEKDELKLCIKLFSKERPAKFSSEADSDQVQAVFKRNSPQTDSLAAAGCPGRAA
jgi:hypothetical protein